jgi:rhodanese-related sulfurtransferase
MKHLLLPALVIVVYFLLRGISQGQAKPREGAVLVDNRSPSEYNAERAKGALLLPHDQVRGRAAQVLPDKSAAIDLYCRSGRRSGLAMEALTSMGYTNVVNLGSIDALKKGGVEMESGAVVPEK